jgi:hypothetical protein
MSAHSSTRHAAEAVPLALPVSPSTYMVSEILQAISVALSSLVHPCQGLDLRKGDPGLRRALHVGTAYLHPTRRHPARVLYLHNLVLVGAQVSQAVLICLLLLVPPPL